MFVAWLLACLHDPWSGPADPKPAAVGAPRVGAAEGELRLPIGTPLSGYSARCTCLGGFGTQDVRQSAYTTSFIESTGVQLWPSIKVIWLSNGGEDLVVTKTDSIYSFDGLVGALEDRLSEATGRDLHGRVIHTANHSHNSWGDYNQGVMWYLGSDKFNREIFERMADQITAVALEAHDDQQDAKIGLGWTKDWDPADRVYHDRRGENNEVQPWGPDGPPLYKDPHIGILRFDTLADEPIAMMVNFGMHGIIGGEQNSLATGDSGAHLEVGLEETFDSKVVVMFTQGSGGDVSPSGVQDEYARMESIGVLGAELVRPLYDAVETSADPIDMETVTRAVHKHPSNIVVTRNGTTDLRYAPYDDSSTYVADNEVYAADGSLLSPIDEFNSKYGGVFCGSGDLDLPIGNMIGVDAFPYEQCLDVELMSSLIEVFFALGEGGMELPLPESLDALTTVSRLGPIPTRLPDGRQVTQPLLVGFFPGEPVYSYGEQWRRRVKDELGFEQAMMVGYSQDHEGYLLMPEDWLAGGYEPDIGIYGPLEAEFVMEQVLEGSGPLLVTADVREDPDPLGQHRPTTYPDVPLSGDVKPDDTPNAGTFVHVELPYLWTPWTEIDSEHTAPTAAELEIPARVPRVQGVVQFAWEGGDPMVDSPEVVLEHAEGSDWVPVTSGSGRGVTDGRIDILVGHTPDPLYPVTGPQTHYWWVGWQAVSHWQDRTALPLGTYRFSIRGRASDGAAETWPWPSREYTMTTDAFEVVPAALSVTEDPYGAGVFVSIPSPANGYRLVHVDGDYHGDNPVVGTLDVVVRTASGSEDSRVEAVVQAPRSFVPLAMPADWVEVEVTDAAGNSGTLTRAFPAP